MLAILVGAALLSWSGRPGGGYNWGSAAIAGACLSWAVDNNLTRKISGSDPRQIAMIKGLAAGTVNTGLGLALGGRLPGMGALLGAGLLGFLGYGLSLTLFVLGLRNLGTARTSAYFSLAPFVGAMVALLYPGEPLTLRIALAGGLMGWGIWLHLSERHEHTHAHEAMDHDHLHVHDEHHQHAHGPSDPPGEPHTHWHHHEPFVHSHPHYPDLHHRHRH
jgi:drug/metabolite transporter (DMT)-like permease